MRKDKDDADDAAKAKNTVASTMDRPANGLPEDLREHARLMCDIIAIAFQTNKTRVASLIISRDLSAMYYPFLDVKDGHHAASHNNNSDGYERIARFHVEPVCLSGFQARQHEGRQRHGARQHLPDVPFQYVDWPQARQHPTCRWCWQADWAGRSRPGAR